MRETSGSSGTFALLTFSPMIDSEACRFVLAHYGKSYQEEAHLFGWASALAFWHAWRFRIPLLYGNGCRLAGPRELVTHFDKSCPPALKLMPSEKSLANQVAADWKRLNGTFGKAVAVFAYYHLLPHRDVMFEPVSHGAPAYERSFVQSRYNAFTGMFKLLLWLSAHHAETSLAIIRSTFDDIDKQLNDGRRYLVGEQLTLSDLALASSAAPILLPEGCKSPMPSFEQMPPAMRSVITEMRQHDCARFVERIYRDHRNGENAGGV